MARKGLNQSGGFRNANIGIIIVWRMKKAAGIGFSGMGIMKQGNYINGFCMDFFRE